MKITMTCSNLVTFKIIVPSFLATLLNITLPDSLIISSNSILRLNQRKTKSNMEKSHSFTLHSTPMFISLKFNFSVSNINLFEYHTKFQESITKDFNQQILWT
uniref:Uncharacterized protein n=1 Tax=Cacopsylla melanoneura TaxID=428564 RepID=A0A8D8PMZ7_9HEMI